MWKYRIDPIKKTVLFVLGSCLMVWGYMRQSGNPAVDRKESMSGEVKKPIDRLIKISLEPDLPEISSGTQ